ncbi:hypothetical protein [Staphylococcus succinus]|nr:hypothetical protein [Staphylococcus succinus]
MTHAFELHMQLTVIIEFYMSIGNLPGNMKNLPDYEETLFNKRN